jgi:hypothetical protein
MPMDYGWLQPYPPGAVVSVWRGFYHHVALLAEAPPGFERRVISLNPGPPGTQLREETVSEFARGKEVVVRSTPRVLHPHWVLARARSGQHPPYSWLEFNCDHFVRFAHGVPVESPQLQAWVAVGLLGAVLLALGGRS